MPRFPAVVVFCVRSKLLGDSTAAPVCCAVYMLLGTAQSACFVRRIGPFKTCARSRCAPGLLGPPAAPSGSVPPNPYAKWWRRTNTVSLSYLPTRCVCVPSTNSWNCTRACRLPRRPPGDSRTPRSLWKTISSRYYLTNRKRINRMPDNTPNQVAITPTKTIPDQLRPEMLQRNVQSESNLTPWQKRQLTKQLFQNTF